MFVFGSNSIYFYKKYVTHIDSNTNLESVMLFSFIHIVILGKNITRPTLNTDKLSATLDP